MHDSAPPPSVKTALPRQRPGLVQRAALQAELDAALATKKLVLLVAPAGYGKTLALARQLAAMPAGHAVAWISASEDDGLHTLLTSLFTALDQFDLPWRISPDALPEMAQREDGLADVARELAHALAQSEVAHGVIAIDDVHRIGEARVFEFFNLLLQELPARWTVAMASRVDPPLALARLRLSDELGEFRERQLRFDGADVMALLRVHKPESTPEEAQALLAATQGWPAGLAVRLMAQGEGRSQARETQLQRHVFDYLAQEVLEQLPGALARFVLRCSVLPEWTPARCEQLTGDAQAGRWLEELERRELFVSTLDNDEFTLRPHDLFRDFLQWRLECECPQDLPGLLVRAAATEPDPVVRVGYLLRGGATGLALQQMLDAALPLIQAGNGDQLVRLADRFPVHMAQRSPDLTFIKGLVAWHVWQLVTVSKLMQQAAEGFEREQRWQLAVKARALGAMALFHTNCASQAVTLLDGAPRVTHEPGTELVWEVSAFVRTANMGPVHATPGHVQRIVDVLRSSPEARDWMSVIHTLYAYVGRAGIMEPMRRLVELISVLGAQDRPLLRGGFTSVMRAWLALWQGDLAAARALATEAEADAAWAGRPASLVVPLQHLRAIDAQLCGRAEEMRSILGGMALVAGRSGERRSEVWYLSVLGAFFVGNHDWGLARDILARIEPSANTQDCPWLRTMVSALQAELLLHDNRVGEAVDLFRQLGPRAADCDWWGLNARVCAGWARAELRAGDAGLAWQALAPVLALAAETGEILGLLLCGPAALEELASAPWTAAAQEPERRVLGTCAARARELRAPPPAAAQKAPAQPAPDASAVLSEREIEVMRLVASGQSNKHIARELDLSPHTVKRHLARILAKTDQPSRGKAAAWFLATSRPSSLAG